MDVPLSDIAQAQMVLRLTLGLIFLLSAVAKLRHPSAVVQGVREYRILPRPLVPVYGWLLPLVELGAALLLLSDFHPVVGACLVVVMLLSFAVAIAVNAARGRTLACHCLGEGSAAHVGWHTLARDLALLPPALWVSVRTFRPADPTAHLYELQPGLAALAVDVLLAALLVFAYLLIFAGFDMLDGFSQRKRPVQESTGRSGVTRPDRWA